MVNALYRFWDLLPTCVLPSYQSWDERVISFDLGFPMALPGTCLSTKNLSSVVSSCVIWARKLSSKVPYNGVRHSNWCRNGPHHPGGPVVGFFRNSSHEQPVLITLHISCCSVTCHGVSSYDINSPTIWAVLMFLALTAPPVDDLVWNLLDFWTRTMIAMLAQSIVKMNNITAPYMAIPWGSPSSDHLNPHPPRPK